ncbi:MAG TPA: mechanosensitive ion channel family protein [Methanosarcinaceae archaeon]|nr:mechanosensitive ion channel family protein [Methanosarcinaceae archaeon]
MSILDTLLSWFTLNIANALFIFVIIIATIIVAKIVDSLLKAQLKLLSSKMNIDETVYGLLRRIVVAFVYLAGILIVISSVPFLENISFAIFASAGFAGLVVGMAAQSSLSNIISGISLAAFRPFGVGDLVTIHDEYGTVSDITLGHTVVTTWDNRRLIIPNHIISDEAIINWSISDPTILWPIDIGIGYDADIDHARSIMIKEAKNHANVLHLNDVRRYHPEIVGGKEMRVVVTELGDFAVNLRLTFWVSDRSVAFITGCELIESIKKRFDAEGIEIPYPYRTIVYKKDITEN